MNVYYMDISSKLYDYNYQYYISHISPIKKDCIDKLKFYDNKKETLYSEVMVKLPLVNVYGFDFNEITFRINKMGKNISILCRKYFLISHIAIIK